MHSLIIQLDKAPIKEEHRIVAEDCYNFCERGFADYVMNVDEKGRETCINNLKPLPGIDVADKNDAELPTAEPYFTVRSKKEYFEQKLIGLKKGAKEVEKITIEEFLRYGKVDLLMRRILAYYEDKYDIWVMLDGEYMPLDRFIRNCCEDGDTYHIGGIVDYHF